MRDYPSELQQVFSDYRADLEACREKYKPTDGLLGLSRSMNDDVCHDRFDERVKTLSAEFASSRPSSETAARMIRMLLFPEDFQSWPTSAQWMLRAAERHSIPLIPFLSREDAGLFCQQYVLRYPPRDLLPVQKKVCKALLSMCPERIK